RLGPVLDEGQELLARDEQQLGWFTRFGSRCAPLAVEQRDLAEEVSRPQHVQRERAAVLRIHCEGDTAGQHAIEPVAGIALLKDLATGGKALATGSQQQLVDIPRRQRGEKRMKAKQLLRRHSHRHPSRTGEVSTRSAAQPPACRSCVPPSSTL